MEKSSHASSSATSGYFSNLLSISIVLLFFLMDWSWSFLGIIEVLVQGETEDFMVFQHTAGVEKRLIHSFPGHVGIRFVDFIAVKSRFMYVFNTHFIYSICCWLVQVNNLFFFFFCCRERGKLISLSGLMRL